MNRFIFATFALFVFVSDFTLIAAEKPNIVLILADDLGYGDVSCYGATQVKTPNIDRLAAEGIRFTDAHAVAATCTPSRFALISGIYPWRKPGTGILPGDASLIIPPKSVTLPSILKNAGYTNGVVGKWHLGLGTPKSPVDWNNEIKPGPLEIGFDYSFIIPATGDRVPCVFVENHHVVNLDPNDPIRISYKEKVGNEPTGKERPDLLKQSPSHGHDMTIVNGISRIGYMTGGKSARWVDENIADTITAKACSFIETNKEKPFFLYFATHDIHVPRVPHPRFVGTTSMGARGDAIVEFDWSVGEILKTLDRLKLADNTIVIVSSDNGPVVDDGYLDRAVELIGNHKPAGALRGGKGSAFEAGTRVPFIIRLPAKANAGHVSDALIALIDLPATFAALARQVVEQKIEQKSDQTIDQKNDPKIPETAIPDSENVLPALLGETNHGRDSLVLAGASLSLRHGTQKVILPNPKGRAISVNTNIETGNNPNPQLYELKKDLREQNNLAEQEPDRWNELRTILQEIRQKKVVVP
ncbi:MAG: arylsulfatase [Planctomycetaceae bacterium]|jgi:arylsulfatase A-like enzyme|nr:arylsulfatase [Planctomycetaceae bacterium]